MITSEESSGENKSKPKPLQTPTASTLTAAATTNATITIHRHIEVNETLISVVKLRKAGEIYAIKGLPQRLNPFV